MVGFFHNGFFDHRDNPADCNILNRIKSVTNEVSFVVNALKTLFGPTRKLTPKQQN